MHTGTAKGTYGYLNRNKVQAWKRAALMLSVPAVVFLAAWILHGTRENVMTVVAGHGRKGLGSGVRIPRFRRYGSAHQHPAREKIA